MEVGFEYGVNTVPVGLAHAASISVSNLWSVGTRTVSTVARIFEPQERKQLHSIVYGYTATQESFATSTTQALWVLALISLSLGIINLFPFLPLDGGHVFWAVAEKVRGKRIPFEVMERAGIVGFALILLIFVIGLTNDISTLSGSGINLHYASCRQITPHEPGRISKSASSKVRSLTLLPCAVTQRRTIEALIALGAVLD